MGDVKDCLRRQHAQLDAILKHLNQNPNSTGSLTVVGNSPPPALKMPAFKQMVGLFACVAIEQVILQDFAGSSYQVIGCA